MVIEFPKKGRTYYLSNSDELEEEDNGREEVEFSEAEVMDTLCRIINELYDFGNISAIESFIEDNDLFDILVDRYRDEIVVDLTTYYSESI